jgi:hypothetical protein
MIPTEEAGWTMVSTRQGKLLVALFLALTLALNFPALTVVEAAQGVIGIAWVPLYVFGVWALAILGAAVLLERRGR